jgi:hypothetical protein
MKSPAMNLIGVFSRRCVPSARPISARRRWWRPLLILRLNRSAAQKESRRQSHCREYISCLHSLTSFGASSATPLEPNFVPGVASSCKLPLSHSRNNPRLSSRHAKESRRPPVPRPGPR